MISCHYVVLLFINITNIACILDSNLIERIRADVTTSQSSTFPYYNRYDVDSSKAIDGLRNYSVDTCRCCSVTDGISPSWWQIDLRSKYLIGALHIFGRAEDSGNRNPWQLEQAQVYTGNESMWPNNAFKGVLVYQVPDITDKQHFIKQLDPIITRFFSVELPFGIMTLCEFMLYEEECDVGSFGNGCLRSCHCLDNNGCNQVTGKCHSPDCSAGWKGKSCEDACDYRAFGLNCSSTCHCQNNTNCKSTTGECYVGLCDTNWQGPSCDQVEDMNNRTQLSNANGNSAYILAVAIGGSVAVLIIIVLTITVVILVLRERKSKIIKTQYSTPKFRINNTDSEYDTLDNIYGNNSQTNSTGYENVITTNI